MNFEIVKTDQQTNFEEIKDLYYKTWTYSYIDLIPQLFLDQLNKDIWHPEKRIDNTLIARVSGKIVGVCSYGPARRIKYQGFGEIYSLYVLPEFQHQKIGQKLFQTALNILGEEYSNIYLIVLKNNLAARAFYELFNFNETDGLITDQTKYGILHEIIYVK